MNETATGTRNEHVDESQCSVADEAQFERVDEYQVPVDPMTELQCDSCQ